MADAPVLQMNGVSKSFGSLEIFPALDFSLSAGESAAIVGPSGAGKSTLLHIAGLMERPTAGEVLLRGRATSGLSEQDRAAERLNTIGFLFQFHYLLPEFTVLENVLMPARLAGDDLTAASRRANEILTRLGLNHRLTHRPSQLSGGEQQRTALARAVLRRPRLLLCDEPTGNLDHRTAQEVTDLLWDEVRREGTAVVVVTHNEALARSARAFYHLAAGKLEQVQTEAQR